MPTESVIAAPKPSISWYCTELVTFHTFPADGAIYWGERNSLENNSKSRKSDKFAVDLMPKKKLNIWNIYMELIII
jgi:hypothetical protein